MDAKHFESHVPIETVTEGINSLMMSWPKMVPSTGKSGGYIIGGIGLLQKILFNQEPGMSSSPPSLFLKGDRFGLHCSHSWHLRTTKVNEENNNKGFSRSSSSQWISACLAILPHRRILWVNTTSTVLRRQSTVSFSDTSEDLLSYLEDTMPDSSQPQGMVL